jgi:hypothetical protein
VLDTVTVTQFEGGIYEPAATASPTDRFGISHSCPFFPLRVELAPAVPDAGEGGGGGGGEPWPGGACELTTPLTCWSPGITPLGCGARTNGATGCWSGFSQSDLEVGLSDGTAE